jgi:hypothetical protein
MVFDSYYVLRFLFFVSISPTVSHLAAIDSTYQKSMTAMYFTVMSVLCTFGRAEELDEPLCVLLRGA